MPIAAVLYIKPPDVRRRLADLDLTVEIFQDVGRAAQIAKTGCSPNHPPTFPGTAAWANTIKHLRDVLIPPGWQRDDPANFSMTINDKRRIYIVVATGDDLTGLEGSDDPQTKTAKGVWAEEALNLNRQLDLFPEAIPEHIRMRPETAGYVAWYLLIVVSAEQVRVELSRTLDMVSD